MKRNLLFLLLIIFCQTLNKAYSQLKLERIKIDNNLDDTLFYQIPTVMKGFSTVTITKRHTGKTDTIGPRPVVSKSGNCQIEDIGRSHYGFDYCMAYTFFTNDTLVLQFQNNNIEIPKFDWWDRLIIHIIRDRFYAEYVYTNKSPYQLNVTRQELVLKRWTKTKGDHLRGELTVQCANHMEGMNIPKLVSFKGFFDVVIE